MRIAFPLVALILFGCKVSEKNLAGTYRLKGVSQTRLVLRDDKTFEFVKCFSAPGPVFFPDSTELNFNAKGNWHMNAGKLVLNSNGNETLVKPVPEKDSITPNTTITSFSFWNEYGEAVPIRVMKFPQDKIKLYKANTISFFAGDFGRTDTLEFHFYGYRPVKWPGSFPRQMADNYSHHITLYEEERIGFFKDLALEVRPGKLLSTDRSFALYKN
jgi:hypothetical protein